MSEMEITIFDGRKIWLKPVLPMVSLGLGTAVCNTVKNDRIEYELNSYTATIRHRLLSIRNIQKLVYNNLNCYKNQVLVTDIRGEYAHIDIYVKKWGIALVQNTLNAVFSEVQHRMIEEMMRNRVSQENYNKIDEIFEHVLKDL